MPKGIFARPVKYTATEAHCSDCKQWLPRSEFASNISRKSGLQSVCKSCFSRRYAKSDPLANRKRHVRRYYGLEWDTYVDLFTAQGGRCRICQTPVKLFEKDKLGVAHVDHDHDTGAVRALLCHFCNSGIGYFRDNRRLLEIAQQYLAAQGGPAETAVEEHW